MSDQYLGEIRAFGFSFAPVGWAQCNGQLMAIQQNTALFSLLGTNFGGNGTSSFGLPNLGGNAPMHWGNSAGLSQYFIGETVGSATETITYNQMPLHSHAVQAAEGGTPSSAPNSSLWLAEGNPSKPYVNTNAPNTTLAQNAIGIAGGSQPHQNMQPYETLNFCVALVGAFPPRG
ncbi:MAG: tail fiber protein [Xanthobacteraceae bacterium]